VRHKFIKPSILTRFFARRSVQLGMKILGAMLFAGGLLTGWKIVDIWIRTGFGPITEFRNAIITMTSVILGIQLMFSAVYVGIFAGEMEKSG
jgi:hypothetical protein